MTPYDELLERRALRDGPSAVEDAEDRAHKRRHEDVWLDVDTEYQRRADRLINDRFEARTAHLKRMWWMRFATACVGLAYLLGLLDVDRFTQLFNGLASLSP
jgi:hypothetical protein